MDFGTIIKRRWPEWSVFALFAAMAAGAIAAPLIIPCLADAKYAAGFNAALSIGTSGLVAFIFYYVVNERIERRKRELVRQGTLRTYRDAKRNIALAIIRASQKGGRNDLSADTETMDKVLTIAGFKELFEGGREAHEGFYAFQNQMSDRTPEYDEIVFNLKIVGRAFERLDAMLRRIEQNGPGYDESKLLCRFMWEIFSGWNFVQGNLGHDPIERTIEAS